MKIFDFVLLKSILIFMRLYFFYLHLFLSLQGNTPVDVMDIRVNSRKHPYIIAIFAPIGNEVKYYVDIQNRIFTVGVCVCLHVFVCACI